MVSKLRSGVALVAMLAMFGAATEASAQVTGTACSSVQLWANPAAGANSALPVSSRYDVMYDVTGGTYVEMGPRNGGVFDAYFCNPTANAGVFSATYSGGDQATSKAPAQSCYQLRGLTSLVMEGTSNWKACVFVRYRN